MILITGGATLYDSMAMASIANHLSANMSLPSDTPQAPRSCRWSVVLHTILPVSNKAAAAVRAALEAGSLQKSGADPGKSHRFSGSETDLSGNSTSMFGYRSSLII